MSDAALSGAILLLALILFASNRVRHDLVAVAALLVCVAFALVSPREALRGFADPAVVTVAAVLVLGRAVELSGVPARVAKAVIPSSAPFSAQLVLLMVMGAALSAFMNNIAALIVTMPLAAQIARRSGRAPGAALMPLSFATILGGMTTLIGTPANLILSSVREEELGEPFSFFAMTGLGAVVAGAGLVYLALIGWKLIPLRRRGAGEAKMPWRVFELEFQADVALPLAATLRRAGARALAVFRSGERLTGREAATPEPGDRLLLISRRSQREVAERTRLLAPLDFDGESGAVTAQVVVGHGSSLIGHGYEAVHAASKGRISVLAGGPRPARLRQPLATVKVQPGDQLFIRGAAGDVAAFASRARLLELNRFDPAPLQGRRAAAALAIFAGAIIAVTLGFAPPAIAFLAAAAAVGATRLIAAEDLYGTIDWSVVVLLAAMIPVGQSFHSTGAADAAADALAAGLGGAPVAVVLGAICAVTLILSIFLNNIATAVVMGPLAIRMSELLGIGPDAALLAVLIGASSDFLTPIGHHNNLLVMGPGGYAFTDYARVGAPLVLLTVAVTATYLALVF